MPCYCHAPCGMPAHVRGPSSKLTKMPRCLDKHSHGLHCTKTSKHCIPSFPRVAQRLASSKPALNLYCQKQLLETAQSLSFGLTWLWSDLCPGFLNPAICPHNAAAAWPIASWRSSPTTRTSCAPSSMRGWDSSWACCPPRPSASLAVRCALIVPAQPWQQLDSSWASCPQRLAGLPTRKVRHVLNQYNALDILFFQ